MSWRAWRDEAVLARATEGFSPATDFSLVIGCYSGKLKMSGGEVLGFASETNSTSKANVTKAGRLIAGCFVCAGQIITD